MDQKIVLFLYNYGQMKKPLYNMAIWITRISQKFFMAVYTCLCIKLILTQNAAIIGFIIGPLSLLIVNLLLRRIFKRERPFKKLNLAIDHKKKDSYSFPSNHAASASVIAFSIFYLFRPIGIILIFCAFMTGLSRIICADHYPADVAAGWVLGIVFASLAHLYI